MSRFALAGAMLSVLVASVAAAGDPVPGVDVLLEQIPGGEIYTAQTDADGNIIFDGLPPGDYRVFQNVERPRINVSGPAVFTPSNGDDIGTLTVTGRAPITIDRITARELSDVEAGRGNVPTATSWNSTRSNTANVAAPLDAAAVRRLSRQTDMEVIVTPVQGSDTAAEPANDEGGEGN